MTAETSDKTAAAQEQQEAAPTKNDVTSEKAVLTNGKSTEEEDVKAVEPIETTKTSESFESTESCEDTKSIESSEEKMDPSEKELKRVLQKDEINSVDEPNCKKVKVSEENSNDQGDELDMNIIRQLEYYFGDINLNYDKFLKNEIAKDEDGWVSIELLMKFKRLASICNCKERLIEALTAVSSNVVQLNEEKTKLRRHPDNPALALNVDHRTEIRKRTAYAKGFPLDSALNELVDFFTDFEGFEHVDMRKYYDRASKMWKFKGSVFVIFKTVEQCESFLQNSSVYYKGMELLRKWQQVYLDEKQEEYKNKLKRRKQKAPYTTFLEDEELKLKKARECLNSGQVKLSKGSIVKFSGTILTDTREDIRSAISKVFNHEVAFIEYQKGDNSGFIRFSEDNIGQSFMDKLTDNELAIGDRKLKMHLLAGEEEFEHLSKIAVSILQRRQKSKINRNLGNTKKGNRKFSESKQKKNVVSDNTE